MSVPSGEPYTQKPVERPAPSSSLVAVNDQTEETAEVKEDSQQQPPAFSQSQPHQQQTPSTGLSDNLNNLSLQEPLQTQAASQSESASAHISTANAEQHTAEDPFGEWVLKEITWPDPRIGGYRRTVKVLTQNANGPCSLLALANVLILRGSIHIPAKLEKITYDALATLIADFLVTRPQDSTNTRARGLTLEAALNILPTTVRGLNVNVGFDEITSFRATEEGSSDELALFAMAGVELVHGWIADKSSSGGEWEALQRVSDEGGVEGEKRVPTYDGVQDAIIKGLDEQGQSSSDAVVLQQFLQNTATQLTFPGLFALNALEPGSVVAFFRNSHLSVLYRRHNLPAPTTSTSSPDEQDTSPTLFQLVTDQSFASEPEITWESIVDIDGAGTTYYNSEFYPAGGAGGDYSGMSAGEVVRRDERARREQEREEARLRGDQEAGEVYEGGYRGSMEDHTDLQLARALQEEEDRAIAEQYRDQEERQHRRQRTQLDPAVRARAAPVPEAGDGEGAGEVGGVSSSSAAGGGREGKGKKEKKAKKDCVVM